MCSFSVLWFFLFLIFFNVYSFLRERERERERERQSVSGRGAEREGDTESKAGSRLRTVSTEPDVGLKPTNREIKTGAKLSRSTNGTTQVPHSVLWFLNLELRPLLCELPCRVLPYSSLLQSPALSIAELATGSVLQKYHNKYDAFLWRVAGYAGSAKWWKDYLEVGRKWYYGTWMCVSSHA